MTDPNPNLDPDEVDEVEQANVAAAAIAGFTLAQFAFGELIRNGEPISRRLRRNKTPLQMEHDRFSGRSLVARWPFSAFKFIAFKFINLI